MAFSLNGEIGRWVCCMERMQNETRPYHQFVDGQFINACLARPDCRAWVDFKQRTEVG